MGPNSDAVAWRCEQSLSFELLSACVKILAQPLAWTSHLPGLSFLICDRAQGRCWVQRAAGPWPRPAALQRLTAEPLLRKNLCRLLTGRDECAPRCSLPLSPPPFPSPLLHCSLLSPFKPSQPFRVQTKKKMSGGLGSSPSPLYSPGKFWLGKHPLANSPETAVCVGIPDPWPRSGALSS